ncbi:MAG: hypothetical protein KJP23_16260 [Deltaproteobacteria bacterium]|nr:hypothetical protein [Deltaproteobacteria bacterium]
MAEFVRMGDSIKDAILTIMKYVKQYTGVEPTQEEVADMLKTYFILNEVGNQIKYQLKEEEKKEEINQKIVVEPAWTLNLIGGPGPNVLPRAGIFSTRIQESIEGIRQFMKNTTGVDPDDDIIAKSLKSNFILSEIKNQIEYQRKQTHKKEGLKKDKSSAAKTPRHKE